MIAALGSALRARQADGLWLVRIDDIDPPREVAGAADAILESLERLGFAWDGPVVYQSKRDDAYRAALETLVRDGLAYPCACSRSQIAEDAERRGHTHRRYPGTCRAGLRRGAGALAIRVIVPHRAQCFNDLLQGRCCEDLHETCGDFVIWRSDGLPAYQLAAAVDDAAQGVTEIVRGADLLDSTLRQNLVRDHLGLPQPDLVHLPVAIDASGDKLSKQTGAAPIDVGTPGRALCAALHFLGAPPPAGLERGTVAGIWDWATSNWSANSLIGIRKSLAGDA